jgi:hypothetical protein
MSYVYLLILLTRQGNTSTIEDPFLWSVFGMVWVQIPSREEHKFDSSQIFNAYTAWFDFQTYI